MISYYAHKLLYDGKLQTHMLLSVDDGVISAIKHLNAPPDSNAYDIELAGLVSPGFIDTQVNGGGGVLFNHEQSVQALETMMNGHSQFGTTSMLPTLITDSTQTMQQAADSIAQAIRQGIKGIAGIHFEGPHLSVAKRGIHSGQQVRPLSDTEMTIVTRKDIGKVILTVAAENVTCDQIRELVSEGVIVSLGHSAASLEQAISAIEAGATGFTHLYNAMSGLTAREPGLIAAALLDERVVSGLIVDMHHVHPYNCKLALHTIGAERLMLVTDAMAQVGSDIDILPWLDSTITRHGDKLTLEDGSIAGSCLDMASAVRNMFAHVSQDLPSILNMASHTPARFLGFDDRGEIAVGKNADFVLLDNNLSCVASWIEGKQVAGELQA
ncbi:N-acetylglucosamine-6-phosphate deacetylase [Alteromonas sp. W364]|jgi:N-acetylglucosamine-6-phosphate deacetylase|uniref:N-acetylglucosamine-6-phosphate deacetylase n=1 Tax=Alteromonas sp. W364 TaxID=3075610 RepID=UPI00288859E6|nr:N-acetylglucosamine-6-phosphate deacetylase [Alteromonas sp. W364]MDT0627896.1 N-acetylglucosamine-6-phosphate deacetylase [Alteromonas sp. W364]